MEFILECIYSLPVPKGSWQFLCVSRDYEYLTYEDVFILLELTYYVYALKTAPDFSKVPGSVSRVEASECPNFKSMEWSFFVPE